MKIPNSALESNATLKRFLSTKIEEWAYTLDNNYFRVESKVKGHADFFFKAVNNKFFFKLYYQERIIYLTNEEDYQECVHFIRKESDGKIGTRKTFSDSDPFGRTYNCTYYLSIYQVRRDDYGIDNNLLIIDPAGSYDSYNTGLYITLDELNNRLDNPYDLSKLITFSNKELQDYIETLAQELLKYHAELFSYIDSSDIARINNKYNIDVFNKIIGDQFIEKLDSRSIIKKAFDI